MRVQTRDLWLKHTNETPLAERELFSFFLLHVSIVIRDVIRAFASTPKNVQGLDMIRVLPCETQNIKLTLDVS